MRRGARVSGPAGRAAGPCGAGPGAGATGMCRTCPVRRGGFCATLPEALLARLAAIAVPMTHRADHWFWDEAHRPQFVAVIRSGYVRMLSYSSDGRRTITGIAGPGAIVGEAGGGRGGYGLEASTDVSLCAFDSAAFAQLEEAEPELRRLVYAERISRLDVLRRHIWSRGIQSPEERLAAFLVLAIDCLPCHRLPEGRLRLALDIPRADIADLLGTSRETISRLTRQWQNEGRIRVPDARHFILEDVGRLAAMGGIDPSQIGPCGAPSDVDAAGGDDAAGDDRASGGASGGGGGGGGGGSADAMEAEKSRHRTRLQYL